LFSRFAILHKPTIFKNKTGTYIVMRNETKYFFERQTASQDISKFASLYFPLHV